MKACMSDEGTLSITGESPIESYALDHWFKEWEEHKSTLSINTPRCIQEVLSPDMESDDIAAEEQCGIMVTDQHGTGPCGQCKGHRGPHVSFVVGGHDES